jgi:hypothetical protein
MSSSKRNNELELAEQRSDMTAPQPVAANKKFSDDEANRTPENKSQL